MRPPLSYWQCSAAPPPPAWLKSVVVTGGQAPRLFSSGDPFTVTRDSMRHARVAVCQGVSSSAAAAGQLVEQMQAAWAARAAGADAPMTAWLPRALDPAVQTSSLIRLIRRLMPASGVQSCAYTADMPCALPAATSPESFLTRCTKAVAASTCLEQAAALAALAGRQAELGGPLRRAWLDLQRTAQATGEGLGRADAQHHVVVFDVRNAPLAADVVHALQRKGGLSARVGTYTCDEALDVALTTAVAGQHVVIVQSTRPEPRLDASATSQSAATACLRALLLQQAAEEAGAARISVVQAYQMNGRSDREEHSLDDRQHAGAYAHLVASWFLSGQLEQPVLVDPHDLHTAHVWSPAARPHAAVLDVMLAMVRDALAEQQSVPSSHRVLVLPDAGAHKRTKEMQGLFERVVVGDKTRQSHDSGAVVGNVAARFDAQDVVILPDDEISGGGTMAQTLQRVRAQGAEQIHVILVHNNMPLDPIERHLRLAWLRWSGATTLRFSDSQPMGTLHNSYAALQEAYGAARVTQAVAAFCRNKKVDATPEALFAGLQTCVRTRGIATLVADAVQPRAMDRNYLQETLFIGQRGHIKEFYDVTAAYEDPRAMTYVAQELQRFLGFLSTLPDAPDALVAPEARAWPLVGLAQAAGPWPTVLLRKSQPCAGPHAQVAYTNKTNGTRQVHLHVPQERACSAKKVVVLDDGISGGRTLEATIKLCHDAGMQVVGVFGMIRYQEPNRPRGGAFWDTWGDRTHTVFDLSPAGQPDVLPKATAPEGTPAPLRPVATEAGAHDLAAHVRDSDGGLFRLSESPALFAALTARLQRATQGATHIAAADPALWPVLGALMRDKKLVCIREGGKLPEPVVSACSGPGTTYELRDKDAYEDGTVVLVTRDAQTPVQQRAADAVLRSAGLQVQAILNIDRLLEGAT